MEGAGFPLSVGRRWKIFSSRVPTSSCLALSQVCTLGKAPELSAELRLLCRGPC